MLIVIILGLASGSELCDISFEAGICLFEGETVLVPYSTESSNKGYWTFDDDSSLDYSSNQNHGKNSVTPGPTFMSKVASAYFSGDYIEIPNDFELNEKLFSITFWMFLPQQSTEEGLKWCPILQKGTDTEEDMLYQRTPAVFLNRETRQLKAYVSTSEQVEYPQGEYVESNARIPYYRWTHVAVVRTQSRLKVYVNGIKDAVNSTEGQTVLNESPLYLGNTPWTLEDCGVPLYLDQVRYFNKELSEERIEAEAFGALGAIEPYYVKLGCVNCNLEEAFESCTETHHLCYSIELHSGAYAVARAMGWTDWNSHLWSYNALEEDTSDSTTGLGICCLNLG